MEKFNQTEIKDESNINEKQQIGIESFSDRVGYKELKDEIKKDESIVKNFDEVAKQMSDLGMFPQDYHMVRDIILLACQKVPYIFKPGDTKKDKPYLLKDFVITMKRVIDGKIQKSDYMDFLNFKNPLMYATGLSSLSVRYLGFTTVFDIYQQPGYQQIAQYFIDAGEGFSVIGETVTNSQINHNLTNLLIKYCNGKFDPDSIKLAIQKLSEKITKLVDVPYDQIFFYSASKYEAFFQQDHFFRDELYSNAKRSLVDYTDEEGAHVAGRMMNDIKTYIKDHPGKKVLIYTSTHGLENGDGVTSIFGSSNDIVFDKERYDEVKDLVLKSGGSVYHDRCYGKQVSGDGQVGTNTANYIGIYNRTTTNEYASQLTDKVKTGTLFMNVKVRELLFDGTKVLNIPELNP